ncbi:uncharacterized protein TNCV_94091 [Trichonephila clavipes]|nr:uncharacterized protein TNCV_94091 [Trichonephila clavipes]
MEEIGGLGIPLRSLWPTLHCRRVAGMSLLLSIGWWYLSLVSPKRHSCRISAADKGCRVYPLDPRPDAVALYSGCTPEGPLRDRWRPEICEEITFWGLIDRNRICSIIKIFLLAKSFIDSTLTVTPHKSLISCRGVISEPDLLCAPEAEILEGLFDQVRRITILRDSTRLPTKHIILTFNNPKLPATIKAGYLNCKIRPYVSNPLRSFKCQRFGHSQTSCHGQLTLSRCASVGHASTDCILEPKCVNCSQPHPSDSKMCPKWKIEKQIQEIKTNKNISYPEARKLIVSQLTQTYAQRQPNPLP